MSYLGRKIYKNNNIYYDFLDRLDGTYNVICDPLRLFYNEIVYKNYLYRKITYYILANIKFLINTKLEKEILEIIVKSYCMNYISFENAFMHEIIRRFNFWKRIYLYNS